MAENRKLMGVLGGFVQEVDKNRLEELMEDGDPTHSIGEMYCSLEAMCELFQEAYDVETEEGSRILLAFGLAKGNLLLLRDLILECFGEKSEVGKLNLTIN
jgi:hypothetical protein